MRMTLVIGESLPPSLRTCEVTTSDGRTQTIESMVVERATVLLFVRHFGCIGCSENVGQLSPRFQELADLDTQVILIGCSPATYIEGFRERHNLLHSPALVCTDPSLESHRAAGFRYGLMADSVQRRCGKWVEPL